MKTLLFVTYLLLSLSFINTMKVTKDSIIPDADSSPLKLDRQELGIIGWKMLHSFAAAYPTEPTKKEKLALHALVNAFRVLYPCEECRGHFNTMIESHPVKDSNRKEVVMYFCELHNIVNKKLGKEEFDCDKAFEFWGGDCGFSGDDEEENANDSKDNDKSKDDSK